MGPASTKLYECLTHVDMDMLHELMSILNRMEGTILKEKFKCSFGRNVDIGDTMLPFRGKAHLYILWIYFPFSPSSLVQLKKRVNVLGNMGNAILWRACLENDDRLEISYSLGLCSVLTGTCSLLLKCFCRTGIFLFCYCQVLSFFFSPSLL